MKNILIHKRRVLIIAIPLLVGIMLTTAVMAQKSSVEPRKRLDEQIQQKVAARQNIEMGRVMTQEQIDNLKTDDLETKTRILFCRKGMPLHRSGWSTAGRLHRLERGRGNPSQ